MSGQGQRRALAGTTPTTEVVRDAVTFPRDRLGEPLDISAERFDAWLAQVRRDAARAERDYITRELHNWAVSLRNIGDARGGSLLVCAGGDIERLPEVTP